jgi:hypothetical protein
LANTKLTSTKPVAVNYTDDSIRGPGGDLIGDQLVPVALLGTEYIAIRNDAGSQTSNPKHSDKVFIFPTQNNTIVTINGVTQPVMNLTGNNKMYYDLGITPVTTPGIPTYITSNYPISVLQIAYKGAEPGASILPALSCTGSRDISYVPAQTTAKLTIVTRKENVGIGTANGYFTLNGNSFALPPSLFQPVLGTDNVTPGDYEWYYFRGDRAGDPVIRLSNSKGVFHAGFFESLGNTASYGYFSNYNKVPIEGMATEPYYIEGEELKLYLNDDTRIINTEWTLPDGSTQIMDTLHLSNITDANNGIYAISAQHINGCELIPDTMFVTVFPKNIVKDDTLYACFGNTATLVTNGLPPYTWTPAVSTTNTASIAATSVGGQVYKVTSNRPGVNTAQLLPNEICKSNSRTVFEYEIPADMLLNTPYLFSADVKYSRGTGTPSIYFTVNGQHVGGQLTNLQSDTYRSNSKTWNGGSAYAKIGVVSDDNNRDICVSNIKFQPLFLLEDKFTVLVSDSLQPTISGDVALCNGTATLNAETGYATYLWNTGETTSSITVSNTGNYWVQVASGTCHGTGYASVAPAPEISIQVPSQVSICIDEPVLSIPFTPISGTAGSFDLTFAEAEFPNIANQQISGNVIDIALPAGISAGIYHGTLIVYEQNCGKQATYQLEIMIKYPKEIITQRWNDVLSIINAATQSSQLYAGAPGETFKAYQWYKNGQAIGSATGSYYYEQSTFNYASGDVYSALLTRQNGDKVFTCDFTPTNISNGDFEIAHVSRP